MSTTIVSSVAGTIFPQGLSMLVKPPSGTAIMAGLTAQDIGSDWCGISTHQTNNASDRRSIGNSILHIFSPLATVAGASAYSVGVDAWSWAGVDTAAAQAAQTFSELTGVSTQVSVFARTGKTATVTVSQGLMVQTPTVDNIGGTISVPNHYGIRVKTQFGLGTLTAAMQIASANAIVSRNAADSADVNLLVTDASDNVSVGHAGGLVQLAGYSTTLTGTMIHNRATITYSASMTPSAIGGNTQVITATNGTAFAVNAPTNPVTGMVATYMIRNTSGGALNTVTWNAVFKFGAAWTQPANGFSRSISFIYDGTNWVELFRSAADVAN